MLAAAATAADLFGTARGRNVRAETTGWLGQDKLQRSAVNDAVKFGG